MTTTGRLTLMHATYARDERPIEDGGSCYACQNFTRAYLRHLIVAKEMLAATLISIHNLYTLVHLMQQARQAIIAGTFDAFAAEFLAGYPTNEETQ